MIDCYGTFSLKNVAVFSISGGYGVVLVDLIEKFGMKVPPFNPEIQEQISKKFFMPGTSPRNPLDLAAQFFFSDIVQDVVNLALSDNNIDGLILDLPSFYLSIQINSRGTSTMEKKIIEWLKSGHTHQKPIIPIIQHISRPKGNFHFINRLSENKIPVFGDPLEFIPILPKLSEFKKKHNINS